MTDPATQTQQESLGDGQLRVRRALISVSDKTGVVDFAKGLAALGSRSSPPAAPRRRCARRGSR